MHAMNRKSFTRVKFYATGSEAQWLNAKLTTKKRSRG